MLDPVTARADAPGQSLATATPPHQAGVHPVFERLLLPIAPPDDDPAPLPSESDDAYDDYPTDYDCDNAAREWTGDRLGGPRE
jgi:hypothetical protein